MLAERAVPKVLPTTVVGSYPQPDWLIDRERLRRLVPRVRMPELWRVPGAWLEQAKDDASLLAIRDMERAGIDIITDGEIRRESYSNHFATALEGMDLDNPATITGRAGKPVRVPRVVGKIRRTRAVETRAVAFLRANTERAIKVTLPGPFTMSRQARNEFYADEEELALDLAAAVNAEAREVKAAGADVVQLDEPWLETAPEVAARYAVRAIDRALDGVPGPTAVHLCFGYAGLVQDKSRGRYGFSSRSPTARPTRSRSRPQSPGSISACCGASRARASCWVSSTSASRRSRRRKRLWPGSARLWRSCRPSG